MDANDPLFRAAMRHGAARLALTEDAARLALKEELERLAACRTEAAASYCLKRVEMAERDYATASAAR